MSDKSQRLRTNEHLLSDFIAEMTKSRRLAARSIRVYSQELAVLRHWAEKQTPARNFSDFREADLRAFLEFSPIERKIGPEAMRRRIRLVKQFFSWLCAVGDTSTNPSKNLKPPPIDRKRSAPALDEAELEGVIRAAAEGSSEFGLRNLAICQFLLETGVRLSEMIALNQRDLDLKTGFVFIKARSGHNARHVAITPTLAQTLESYLRWKGKSEPGAPLFSSARGTRLSARATQDVISAAARSANISRISVSAQTLRNTFVKSKLGRVRLPAIAATMGLSVNQLRLAHGDRINNEAARIHAEHFLKAFRS